MADEEGAASPPKGACAGAVSCQFKGKGPIVEGLWLAFEPGDANKGTLTFREKDADGDVLRTAEMEGCAVSPPKNARKGFELALRVDLHANDSLGCIKYIIAPAEQTEAELERWNSAFASCSEVQNPLAEPGVAGGAAARRDATQIRWKLFNDSLSVALFAHLGVLMRIGLKTVSASSGSTLAGDFGHGFFLQNMVGSALMGFAKTRETSSTTAAVLATGFTTGLCGSLTTFATWMGAVSTALRGLRQTGAGMLLGGPCDVYPVAATTNATAACAAAFGPAPDECAMPPGFADACVIVLLGGAISLQSLRFGRHLARTLPDPLLPAAGWDLLHSACTKLGQTAFLCCLLLPLTVLLWVFVAMDFSDASTVVEQDEALLAKLQDASMDDDDIVLPEPVPTTSLAVALAPIGAVLRFHLSKLNGALTDDFPLGTFAANLLGSILAAVIALILAGGGLSAATIAILSACLTGITGSLSTVSTFVNEIDGLGAQVDELVLHGRQVRAITGWRAYTYAGGSVVITQVVLAIIYLAFN